MIDFEQVPRVALDFMNQDHEAATHITNHLMALVDEEQPDIDAITAALDELLEHCQAHFAREEFQMQQAQFPPYPIHQREHQRVLTEMSDELETWKSQQDVSQLKGYLFATLPTWFIEHIATMDTITARFVAQAGGPFEV